MRIGPWLAVSAMLQFAVVAVVQAEDLKSLTNEQLVARLVSPNKPPKESFGGLEEEDQFRLPADYDHRAQMAVCLAAEELLNRGKDSLPELFKHIDDDQYSISRRTGSGAVRNVSVGAHCHLVATSILNALTTRGHSLLGGFRWRKEYEGLSLWEIQQEVLKERLRSSYNAAYSSAIREEIAKLERSRQPVKNTYPWASMAFDKNVKTSPPPSQSADRPK